MRILIINLLMLSCTINYNFNTELPNKIKNRIASITSTAYFGKIKTIYPSISEKINSKYTGIIKHYNNNIYNITAYEKSSAIKIYKNIGDKINIGDRLIDLIPYNSPKFAEQLEKTIINIKSNKDKIKIIEYEIVNKLNQIKIVKKLLKNENKIKNLLEKQLLILNNNSLIINYQLENFISSIKYINKKVKYLLDESIRINKLFNNGIESKSLYLKSEIEKINGFIEKINLDDKIFSAKIKKNNNINYIINQDIGLKNINISIYKSKEKLLSIESDIYNLKKKKIELTKSIKNEYIKSNRLKIDLKNRSIFNNKTTIFSKNKGIIINRLINHGDWLSQGELIFKIIDLSSLWVFLSIPEEDLKNINIGQQIKIENKSLPEKITYGIIDYKGYEIDIKTRTIQVRAKIDNKELNLLPNMYINAFIDLKSMENKLSIPDESIIPSGDKNYVFIKTNNDTYKLREVIVSKPYYGRRYISSGLEKTDEIVQYGLFLLDSEANLNGLYP